MSGDRDFLRARLTATRALIVRYEAAIDALVVGGVQSYTLNTSQSVQTVTKFDITNLHDLIDRLYNRCATLEARLGMNGSVITGAPDW